jgi:hypothetical protein
MNRFILHKIIDTFKKYILLWITSMLVGIPQRKNCDQLEAFKWCYKDEVLCKSRSGCFYVHTYDYFNTPEILHE